MCLALRCFELWGLCRGWRPHWGSDEARCHEAVFPTSLFLIFHCLHHSPMGCTRLPGMSHVTVCSPLSHHLLWDVAPGAEAKWSPSIVSPQGPRSLIINSSISPGIELPPASSSPGPLNPSHPLVNAGLVARERQSLRSGFGEMCVVERFVVNPYPKQVPSVIRWDKGQRKGYGITARLEEDWSWEGPRPEQKCGCGQAGWILCVRIWDWRL